MLIKSNDKYIIKSRNLGIEILRVLLCLWVLLFHYLDKNRINYFLFYITKTKFSHVPCFSFLSFYFSSNIFFNVDIIRIRNRLERLLIPYIGWPLIIFIIKNIYEHKYIITLYDLKIQLIFGRQFIVPLWYLFSMILLTIIFYMLKKILHKYFLFTILLLSILSYMAQYFDKYKFFDGYRENIKKSILDTISIFPLSVLGIIVASSNFIKFLQRYRFTSLFFSYIFIFFIFKCNIFVDIYGYNGIVHIFTSLLFFIAFYFLPLENINLCLQKVIKQITSYTNGIYCLHTRIMFYFIFKFQLKGSLKNGILL